MRVAMQPSALQRVTAANEPPHRSAFLWRPRLGPVTRSWHAGVGINRGDSGFATTVALDSQDLAFSILPLPLTVLLCVCLCPLRERRQLQFSETYKDLPRSEVDREGEEIWGFSEAHHFYTPGIPYQWFIFVLKRRGPMSTDIE